MSTRRAFSLLLPLAALSALLPCLAQADGGTWIDHTLDHRAQAMVVQGDILWIGTAGGLLR
ncbi:MAG: hypothetical protein JXA14_24010, partial [Anaerolineae bacterium]|nr:hypothetical protein [Anaerolineae bacterium]